LNHVSLDTGVPCAFGVLTCYTLEQAVARSSDDEHNKGVEAARAAVETLCVLDQIASEA
jgi:6,7-dimethyl-8-ribityllumazine synthase